MTTVGIRELRQRASELLRRVEAGETIEVQGPMEWLKAAGDLIPSQGNVQDLPDPLPLGPGQEAPSRVLDRLRRDGR